VTINFNREKTSARSLDLNHGQFAESMIEIRGLQFAYPDGTSVIGDISQSVPIGSTLGVVGPSGCGKSTLLAIIAGLLTPTGGSIELPLKGSDHQLAMLFQQDTVLPWLTVRANVALFARFKSHGLRPSIFRNFARNRNVLRDPALRKRVDELLALVDLSNLADRYPYQLSGGQRRRLAFLTAVAPEPRILLLDEPLSSLDEPTRVGVHQDMFRISRLMGMTIILVTHDLAEAISLSDRVVVLSKAPSSISFEHDVPFGSERNMLELRNTPEFLQLYGDVWENLSAQMVKD